VHTLHTYIRTYIHTYIHTYNMRSTYDGKRTDIQANYLYMQSRLTSCALAHGERLLTTPANTISMGMYAVWMMYILVCTHVCIIYLLSIVCMHVCMYVCMYVGVSLSTLQGRTKPVTYFGSMLFSKCVSGTRFAQHARCIQYIHSYIDSYI
jgi:hypothetical protein